MTRKAAFVYEDAMSRHTLSETHPMRPVRLRYTYELADAYGLFDHERSMLTPPRPATVEEVSTFHTPEYISAVERVGQGDFSVNPVAYNIGPGDNPGYEGMYDAALLSTGGSMRCVELLLDEGYDAAFNVSGGLHHAMPGYAYGFCVFNDPVIAINEMLRRGLRVAYVDIDCHHGDGVQYAFYDTDRVLTISLHETGQFLFPGTGYTQETGTGRGRGYSVNVPLYPYTGDETYLLGLRASRPSAARRLPSRRAGLAARHRLTLPRSHYSPRPNDTGIRQGGGRVLRQGPQSGSR